MYVWARNSRNMVHINAEYNGDKYDSNKHIEQDIVQKQ